MISLTGVRPVTHVSTRLIHSFMDPSSSTHLCVARPRDGLCSPMPAPQAQGDFALKAHVASACFECFSCFRGILQGFRVDIAKVDRDAAYVASVLGVCCKRLFKIFHLFQTYVASVSVSGSPSESSPRRTPKFSSSRLKPSGPVIGWQ